MKPLSEVAPGLLVIQILIKAVCRGALHWCHSQWSIGVSRVSRVSTVQGVKGVKGQNKIPYAHSVAINSVSYWIFFS